MQYDGYVQDLSRMSAMMMERKRLRITEVDALLIAAGEIACSSLTRLLAEQEFWTWISNTSSRTTRASEEYSVLVAVAVAPDVLIGLGYKGPPSAQDLVNSARSSVEEAIHAEVGRADVSTTLGQLRDLTCRLADEAQEELTKSFQPSPATKLKKARGLGGMLTKAVNASIGFVAGAVTILGFFGFSGAANAQQQPPPAQPPPVVQPVDNHHVDGLWCDYFERGVPHELSKIEQEEADDGEP